MDTIVLILEMLRLSLWAEQRLPGRLEEDEEERIRGDRSQEGVINAFLQTFKGAGNKSFEITNYTRKFLPWEKTTAMTATKQP